MVAHIKIREERAEDHAAVAQIIKEAFQDMPYSDQSEHILVDRLREHEAFIPALSMVAELKGELVGHILLTQIQIKHNEVRHPSLALAPVSVKPGFQKQGIGGRLIREAHETARRLGFTSVILLGHPSYYMKFGYEPASKYHIQLPFDVPDEYCMAISLTENGLAAVKGQVIYPEPFLNEI